MTYEGSGLVILTKSLDDVIRRYEDKVRTRNVREV